MAKPKRLRLSRESDIASGLVGWALAGALLQRLVDRKMLPARVGQEVIDDALSALEALSEKASSKPLRRARQFLERSLAAWADAKGGRKTIPRRPRRKGPSP